MNDTSLAIKLDNCFKVTNDFFVRSTSRGTIDLEDTPTFRNTRPDKNDTKSENHL